MRKEGLLHVTPGPLRLSLIALLPPGSVEAEVGKVQQSVFSTCGTLSAIALPPLIPIGFVRPATEPAGLLASLNARASAPYRIRFGGFSRHAGFLYLAIDSGGLWNELRKGIEGALADDEGLFPGFEGFFLGCAKPDQELAVVDAPEFFDSSFSSCRLALLILQSRRSRESWWREVSWEIVTEIPLRGRRRS